MTVPMQGVSIETSVVSFLRVNSAASAESVTRQSLTRRWWNLHRQRHELVTSQYVLDEADAGRKHSLASASTTSPAFRSFRSATRSTCSGRCMMTERPDPIIEEIYETRRQIAKRFGGDVHRITADARQRQQQEGRPLWQPKPLAKQDASAAEARHQNG